MDALLSIGAFARAAGPSPKALRLYDELGLLRPAVVDADSGYRFYDPAQLERARLIAWLRRLGMPLDRIGRVCDLEASAAAEQVAAFWARTLADTAARGRMAAFLVDYLSGRGSAVDDAREMLGVRYAARSESGSVRTSNEDSVYAGGRLLAVADGMRGPGGGRASSAAVEALTVWETLPVPADDLLGVLTDVVARADEAVGAVAASSPDGTAVTTLTALLWSGSRLGLVHVGDSRAYLVRGGEMFRITHDHTWVQSLVDEGRLSEAEAASHPQRALLVRALTGAGGPAADVSLRSALPGDRYLLCSDGLSAVVDEEALREVLVGPGDPQRVLDALMGLAYAAGAPDNVAVVVADVVSLAGPAAGTR